MSGDLYPSLYPSYLEMRQWLPRRVWHAARVGVLAGTFGLVALLFAAPRIGLIAWWLFVLPCLPALLMLAPGVWRNLCPMATLNQAPRLFGFSRNLVVPEWLRRQTILIQAVLYFALISMRAPLFDHYGWAVGILFLVAFGSAFLGGVIFKGKSGWCGTFCPLMPIQRLYGQTPALVVPNSHCSTCVGCTKNCIDLQPRLAVITEVRESDPYRLGQLKFFAGAFPGFVIAFFTVPQGVIAGPVSIGVSLGRYYLLTLVYMLVSLGCFFLLDALAPVSELVLMATFGALGLSLHNFLRFSTAFYFHKPLWLAVVENLAVVAIAAQFVVRTYRLEKDLEKDPGKDVAGRLVDERPSTVIRPRAKSDPSGSSGTDGHELSFARGGPRVVVPAGTSLLEAAERADLQVESGCRMGVCGADPIAVITGGDQLSPPSPGERSTLQRLGLGEDCRMACAARVRGDVEASFDLTAAAAPAPVRMEIDYDRGVAHVVIIGNGIAGNTAADHLRRHHPDCTIDIVGEELHPIYNRMGIARMVYGRSAMSGLQLFTDEWYERNGVTLWLNTRVSEIDRPRREVVLGAGERLPYDRLILTMGAATSVPPIQGLNRPAVFVLRSADDAAGIRAYAQRHRCRRAIVVGGGLLGLEAAYALHTFGTRPTVVQRSARLLTGQFDQRAAGLIENYLTGLGIHLILGVTPDAVIEQDGGLALSLSDGSAMATDMVILCTGIRPNVDLAVAAGLDADRGVLVDDSMKTSDPHIYAAGDIAQYRSQIPGLWPIAVEQAEVAATNIAGGKKTYEPRPHATILKGIGLSATAIGEVEGRNGDEILVREPPPDDLRYLKLVIRHGILIGAVLLGGWPEATPIIDAVASGRNVSSLIPALRTGDMSPLNESA